MKNKQIIKANMGSDNLIKVIEASGKQSGDLTKIYGVAYSGGFFNQYWSNVPCVTDLGGLTLAAQIPLLYNHFNDPDYRLGEVIATIADGKIMITGGIDGTTERGAKIVEAGKKCEWQLSHCAFIDSKEFVPVGESREINGQKFDGPFIHITKATLREVSVVAIGADADTNMRVAAGFTNTPPMNVNANANTKPKGEPMNPKLREYIIAKFSLANNADDAMVTAHLTSIGESVQAMQTEFNKHLGEQAVAIERQRVTAVRAALKDCPQMIDKAIDNGWDEAYCKNLNDGVKSATAGFTGNTANIIVNKTPKVDSNILTAALEFRAGIDVDKMLKAHGEQVLDQADKLRGISLQEVVIKACQAKGIHTGVTFDKETIQAAFSTTDLPLIMSNVANKAMLKAFDNYPVIATKLCSAGDLNDYKEATRVRLNDMGDLQHVPAGGEVPNTYMSEEGATNKIKRYAQSFWLDEILIINDDLGAFLDIPQKFGAIGARKIDKVFFSMLLGNPNSVFSSDNSNYLTGTSSALSLAALKSARAKFLSQTDAKGDPINVTPRFLVVPTTLEGTAQELVQSAILVGGSTAQPNKNIVSEWGLEVICSPYLDNLKYTGNSETGWYLFGNPAMVDTFEIGYLKGQRTPTVTRGQFDLNRFGYGYRVSFNFGINPMDHRGMVFNSGVA